MDIELSSASLISHALGQQCYICHLEAPLTPSATIRIPSAMLALIVQGILLYGLTLACWRIVRQYIVNTALDNIPGPPSPSFFKGSFRQLFNIHAWGFHEEIAAKYGGVIKLKGLFGKSQLYVFDPKALHHIVVKDQYVYEMPAETIQRGRLIFGKTLANSIGEHHRRQRKMLNPAFSIAHMRELLPVFYSVSHRLRDSIAKRINNGPQEIDVASWMSRTALELISQSGFGYSFDTLAEDVAPNPYSASMKQLGPAMMRFEFLRLCLWRVLNIGTPKFRRVVVDLLPWKNLHNGVATRYLDVHHHHLFLKISFYAAILRPSGPKRTLSVERRVPGP